jgi:TRAP-type C4-dicarboxylate transport system substrate-binding protein
MLGRLLAIGVALSVLTTGAYAQAVKYKFAVPASLTVPRGIVAKRFADEVEKRSQGKIVFEIFADSQLFPGAEEPKALSSGAIDVAIPNMSLIGSIEPNADIFTMPVFFGASAAQVRAVLDGAPGQDLYQRIEKRLGVKVLGAGFDNGPDVIVTSKRAPETIKDLAGLKVRAPGGPKYSARLQALGATPVFIRFEDLALALTQGTVDAVMTNDGGVVQGKLWELGIQHALLLDLGWAPLVPIMSQRAWDRLGAEGQKLVTSTWNDMLPGIRTYLDGEMAVLRKQMADAKIKFHTPKDEEVQALRDKLMAVQPALATETRVDPQLLAAVQAIMQTVRK